MKHLKNFNDWQTPVNESLDPVTLQIGAVLAVLGIKTIRAILMKIGKHAKQTPEELKEYTDMIIDKAKEADIKITLSDLRESIFAKIDSGEIKTCNDILKLLDFKV